MDRLLNMAKFRNSHTVPVGSKVPLTGILLCKPNYKENEVELVPYTGPTYPTRENFLKQHPKSIAANVTSDFYDRVMECCRVYANEVQSEVLTDAVIDALRNYRWRNNSKYRKVTNPTLVDFLSKAFDMYGVELPATAKPQNVWGKIFRGEYKPSVKSIIHRMTKVVRYKGSHVRQVVIPTRIASNLHWEGTVVGLYERDGRYFVMPVREHDLAFYNPDSTPATEQGRVNLGRYLYLTKEQRMALGFKEKFFIEGYMVKMTIDLQGESALSYTLASEEDKKHIPTFSDALRDIGRKSFYTKKRTVLTNVCNCIILPAAFSKQEGLGKDDFVRTVIQGRTLYVYGLTSTCDFTGIYINKKTDKDITVPVCNDCDAQLPNVRNRVRRAGSVASAIIEVKNELASALHDVENYERGL